MASRASTAIESLQIGFNSSTPTEENFTNQVKRVTLSTNAQVYINFDAPADTGNFILRPEDDPVELHSGHHFTRLSALGVSGSGTLYVIACRD